jgi:hypothetical protein
MKRNISDEVLLELIERIELELFEESEGDIETRDVGQKVSQCLLGLDHVAYVRFASVYCEYNNAEDFRSAVEDLAAKENGGGGVDPRLHARDDRREVETAGRKLGAPGGNGSRGRRLLTSLEK